MNERMTPLVEDGVDHEITTAEELITSIARSTGTLGTGRHKVIINETYMKRCYKDMSMLHLLLSSVFTTRVSENGPYPREVPAATTTS